MRGEFEGTEVLIELESTNGVVNAGRNRLVEVLGVEPLDCGGAEGKKSRFQILELGSDTREEILFAKEYRSEADALKIVGKFEILRERGYNVPPDVYYMHRNGKHYIVMTDLSENGAIPIWSSNYKSTDSQLSDLKRMQPTRTELERSILPMAKQLDQDNCLASRDVWLIRRVPSGELQAFLVDITFLELNKSTAFREDICELRAKRFIEDTLGDVDFLNNN